MAHRDTRGEHEPPFGAAVAAVAAVSSAVQNGQICRLPSVQTKELRLPLLPNVVRFASRMFMRTIAQ